MEELFISCPHHFEELLADELRSLEIKKIRLGFCGVYAPLDMENVYKINYCSRIATRVLWPLIKFGCPDKEALYSFSKRINWMKYLRVDQTFAIDANVQHHNLKNSHFASLVVKDAICDFFRDKTGERPSINIQHPDVQLNLFIQKGLATLYLDTSGAPLHKRGWRTENTEATLHESIAAALLKQCGFTENTLFCDPFCGSGTFLIEAAMIATRTPSGYFRKHWGFMNMPIFDETLWQTLKQKEDAKIRPLPPSQIFGADKDPQTFRTCYKHIKETGFRGLIDLENQEIASYTPKQSPELIVCNPPYGKRLQLNASVSQGIQEFRRRFPQAKLCILTSEESMMHQIDAKTTKLLSFKNGGISVSLFSFNN